MTAPFDLCTSIRRFLTQQLLVETAAVLSRTKAVNYTPRRFFDDTQCRVIYVYSQHLGLTPEEAARRYHAGPGFLEEAFAFIKGYQCDPYRWPAGTPAELRRALAALFDPDDRAADPAAAVALVNRYCPRGHRFFYHGYQPQAERWKLPFTVDIQRILRCYDEDKKIEQLEQLKKKVFLYLFQQITGSPPPEILQDPDRFWTLVVQISRYGARADDMVAVGRHAGAADSARMLEPFWTIAVEPPARNPLPAGLCPDEVWRELAGSLREPGDNRDKLVVIVNRVSAWAESALEYFAKKTRDHRYEYPLFQFGRLARETVTGREFTVLHDSIDNRVGYRDLWHWDLACFQRLALVSLAGEVAPATPCRFQAEFLRQMLLKGSPDMNPAFRTALRATQPERMPEEPEWADAITAMELTLTALGCGISVHRGGYPFSNPLKADHSYVCEALLPLLAETLRGADALMNSCEELRHRCRTGRRDRRHRNFYELLDAVKHPVRVVGRLVVLELEGRADFPRFRHYLIGKSLLTDDLKDADLRFLAALLTPPPSERLAADLGRQAELTRADTRDHYSPVDQDIPGTLNERMRDEILIRLLDYEAGEGAGRKLGNRLDHYLKGVAHHG